MNNFLNKLIMYHEIHKLKREGHSINYISDFLGINWRTVKKYLAMDEVEYEHFIEYQSNRRKELEPYEHFIHTKIEQYRSISAAQLHDFLKEHYPDFPEVSPKTVFNFVMYVRQKYNLPKITNEREYMLVDELPYGKQSQVDFGEYNMRTTKSKRVKVYFFAMVLSRSRQKYIYFSDTPFTTVLSITAHEKAFAFFDGIPQEIVYDQDSVFISSENRGDLILTKDFNSYTKHQKFDIYFCRKADPETKGKVENVVKYVKQNFLYNRSFEDIETLNGQAIAWLHRTGNYMEHGKTKLRPSEQWLIEKTYLQQYKPMEIELSKGLLYTVRKDNSISYKSNLYTLPQGTWKGSGTQVEVFEENGFLVISFVGGEEICRHKKDPGKGKTISNTDHRRDKSDSINNLQEQVLKLFTHQEKSEQYLKKLRKEKSRYVRDQFGLITECAEEFPQDIMDRTLSYCLDNNILSATDFKNFASNLHNENSVDKNINTGRVTEIKTLNNSKAIGSLQPQTSQIADYDNIILN